jgi:acyl carrier protein
LAIRNDVARIEELVEGIRSVLLDSLSVRVDSPGDDLFGAGVLDSMALVRFIMALEDRFGVEIPLDEVDVESFRSMAEVAAMLAGYMNRNGSTATGD